MNCSNFPISAQKSPSKFWKPSVSSHWGFETVADIVATVTLGNQAIWFQWEQSWQTKFSQKRKIWAGPNFLKKGKILQDQIFSKKRKETKCLPLCSVPLKQPSFLVSADSEWEHCHQVWFHQPTNQTSKQGSKESSKEATKQPSIHSKIKSPLCMQASKQARKRASNQVQTSVYQAADPSRSRWPLSWLAAHHELSTLRYSN